MMLLYPAFSRCRSFTPQMGGSSIWTWPTNNFDDILPLKKVALKPLAFSILFWSCWSSFQVHMEHPTFLNSQVTHATSAVSLSTASELSGHMPLQTPCRLTFYSDGDVLYLCNSPKEQNISWSRSGSRNKAAGVPTKNSKSSAQFNSQISPGTKQFRGMFFFARDIDSWLETPPKKTSNEQLYH